MVFGFSILYKTPQFPNYYNISRDLEREGQTYHPLLRTLSGFSFKSFNKTPPFLSKPQYVNVLTVLAPC